MQKDLEELKAAWKEVMMCLSKIYLIKKALSITRYLINKLGQIKQ